jgi:hypothetical protein
LRDQGRIARGRHVDERQYDCAPKSAQVAHDLCHPRISSPEFLRAQEQLYVKTIRVALSDLTGKDNEQQGQCGCNKND